MAASIMIKLFVNCLNLQEVQEALGKLAVRNVSP
jgi:hypothetical protein